MRKLMVGLVIFLMASIASSAVMKNPCKNKEYPKVMKQKTEADFSKNDYYLALDDILAVKKCDPKDPEVYYWLGRIYQARLEMGKAEENFLQAVQLNKNYSQVYMALGNLYLKQNKNERALENYQKAAGDDTYRDAYIAWNNIGWIYMLRDNLVDAEQAFLKSLAFQPGFCAAFCNMGELRAKQKRYAEAIIQFQKSSSLCPDYSRPHRLLGLEYNREGKVAEACSEFELARKIAPADSDDGINAVKYLKILNCPEQPGK